MTHLAITEAIIREKLGDHVDRNMMAGGFPLCITVKKANNPREEIHTLYVSYTQQFLQVFKKEYFVCHLMSDK